MRVDGRTTGNDRPWTSIGAPWTSLEAYFPTADLFQIIANANREAATSRPIEAAFLLSAKHRRHLAKGR